MASTYQPGNEVRARVTKLQDSGVWVRLLPDQEAGFIRRRELSWDRRVSVLPAMPPVGSIVNALIIEHDESRGLLYLSIRQVDDPWPTVFTEPRFRLSNSVTGEVVHVRHGDAFIQVEPGIEAHIVRSDVPALPEQGMEDILWVGDQVHAAITGIDETQHWLEVSIAAELKQLALISSRGAAQYELFNLARSVAQSSLCQDTSRSSQAQEYQLRPAIPRPQMILVVDDEEPDRSQLCDWLHEAYGVPVEGAGSSHEAITKLDNGSYGLAIVDLNLNGERGDQAAERLRERIPGLPVIYVSLAAFTADEQDFLEAQGDPLIRKERVEVIDWVDRLCAGYQRRVRQRSRPQDTEVAGLIQQLGMNDFMRQPLAARIQDTLRVLRCDIRISQAIVVELNPALRSVAVVAADPPLASEVIERFVGALYYSPVRDVIDYDQDYRFRDDDEAERARARNLFPGLSFRSAYGLPITAPGQETRQALFLLDDHLATFSKGSRRRIELARVAARLLAAALENQMFLDRVRRYQQQYTRGELLAGLIHELRHKVNALAYPSATLQEFSRALSLPAPVQLEQWREDVQESVDMIAELGGDLADLITAYEHLATKTLEAVDVNAVVVKTQRQLARVARASGVTIELDLAPDPLLAQAIAPQLAQVLTNLVMNATQHINLQTRVAGHFAADHSVNVRVAKPGQVWICTSRSNCPDGSVIIQIIDSGPGIHRLNHDRIFAMDFSTRGGAGLGLYISRSLIEMMGGSLDLTASLMFIGSAFTIRLRCNRGQEELADA
jgi:signal transduction histidine kinase/predicted RNA-binding protein with RPS1 domain